MSQGLNAHWPSTTGANSSSSCTAVGASSLIRTRRPCRASIVMVRFRVTSMIRSASVNVCPLPVPVPIHAATLYLPART